MTLDRTAIARILDQIGSYYELQGDNPFRIRAFRMASRTIQSLPVDPETALADGSLANARAIGPAILGIVKELIETGHAGVLDELREQIPPGLVEMLDISGLGVAKVRQIHQRLGIDSIAELEDAAQDGRLAALPGFGLKTAENVLKGIARLRRVAVYRLAHHAARDAEALREAFATVPGVLQAIVAGEVRRRLELVREIVIVLVSDHPAADIFGALRNQPGVTEFGEHDERWATVRLAGGASARVVVTPPVNLGAVLVQATGSDAHLAELTARAETMGYTLHGTALWHGREFVATPTEAALYHALGLVEIPPELREGRGEIALATKPLPPLIERRHLRGFIHCHTNYSDGSLTVRELAAGCRDAGYEYVGITDHSRAAADAGGLTVEDLERQWAEVDAANAEGPGIRILKGIEVDILADGRLDYEDEVLARFDFVIASIHARFQMDREAMTARILTAMNSPYLNILGHLTGRLLLSRDPYPLDLDRIFGAAAERGIAIEINADPERLDLDWRVLPAARAAGVMISIGADAHNLAGLGNVDYGVGIARKGGLGPADILNTRSVEEFLAFVQRRRPA